MDFLAISGCDTSLYNSQGGTLLLSLCALRYDCKNVLYFIPNSRRSNSNSDRFSLYNFVDILFDGASTSGIGLQRPALTNAD